MKEVNAAAPMPVARDDVRDAERWRMLPAFIEDHQIDYLRLLRQIDAAIQSAKGEV